MDKLITSCGNTANYTGTALEQSIEARLIELDIIRRLDFRKLVKFLL